MNTLIPVSSSEFRENVKIRFNNIMDGLDNYLNFEINGNHEAGEEEMIRFITEVFELNGNEAYIDLYLNNLDESAKNNLLSLCCPEDKDTIIEQINSNHNEPYYKVCDKSLIPFLVRLNTREVFFVTFYFNKKHLTIWGNYNMKFPCFVETEDALEIYKKKAKIHSLT